MITRLTRAFFSSIAKPDFAKISKVAVFSAKKYDTDEFNRINEKAEEKNKLHISYHPEELNARTAKLCTDVGTVCNFVNDKVNAQCLTILKDAGVQLLALRYAGFNNVDLKKAEELGIKVVRVPAYSPYAVAEYAMGVLQTLNRHIHKAYNRTREGNFALDGLLGFDLHGKTVGIIGGGKIGRCFASICKGFGMNIFYYDQQNVKEMDDLGAKFTDLNTIFSQSDVISLHCPLTPQTHHIINKARIDKIKDTCLLINTGRGGLIDTKACIESLKNKELRGLCIDVYELEENFFFRDLSSTGILSDDDLGRLLSFPNVIVTGHQAFFTAEALNGICTATIDNILEFGRNGKCKNEVVVPKKEESKK